MLVGRWENGLAVVGLARALKWRAPTRLTPPSSGQATAGFAVCCLPLMSNVSRLNVNYRTFSLLCGLASAALGMARYVAGEGPLWQVPVLAAVGASAPFIFALVAWVLVAPGDACGVAKEVIQRLFYGGRNG